MTPEQQAIEFHLKKPEPKLQFCGCLGPKFGAPLCPCAMRYVEVVDGKYYQISWDYSDGKRNLVARCIGDVDASA